MLPGMGRRSKKEDILKMYEGRVLISPNGREYQRGYEKVGKQYIIIIIYKGYRMQVKEVDFNRGSIDEFLNAMEISNC
jgi:hypothetical protein